MLNKNLIRLAASDTTGKAAERKEDAGDVPSVVNEGDIEKLFANTEFFATEADDEDFMPLPDDESEHGGNNTVYPSWWPYNNKTRPEVVLVKNPNVPGGQQVLIKRHFSEANTVMHGGSLKTIASALDLQTLLQFTCVICREKYQIISGLLSRYGDSIPHGRGEGSQLGCIRRLRKLSCSFPTCLHFAMCDASTSIITKSRRRGSWTVYFGADILNDVQ